MKANCELWQKHTSSSLPIDDIREVVYAYSIEGIETMLSDSLKSNNKFVQWIIKRKDKEVIDFLILAKRCEDLRFRLYSAWYYPSKKDSTKYSLQNVITDAMAYKGTRLKSRYALQAVRAMYTLAEWDDCCDYWAKIEHTLPNDVLKNMIMDYAAACEYKRGNKNKARAMYVKLNNWQMILECEDSIPSGTYSKLEIGLKHAPNTAELKKFVSDQVSLLDIRGCPSWRWDEETDEVKDRYTKLLKLCVATASRSQVRDKTFWWYSAAIIAEKLELDNDALNYIVKAEQTCNNPAYSETLKVARIYFTSKTMKCDSKYEDWVYAQVRWYASKIKANIGEGNLYFGDLKGCLSFHYWNDMMRKMVLGVACKRLIENGRDVYALQLANMADNYYVNLCDQLTIYDYKKREYADITMKEYRATTEFNNWDYSNAFFTKLNFVDVDDIITYVKVSLNPKTERDRYFAKHSYIDKDYLYDAVGTMLLREMRYAEAEKYFRDVNYGYQKRLNTDEYLDIYPFDYGNRVRKATNDAKYEFAREMRQLEEDIKVNRNPNRKAEMMLRFALGMRKSVDESWALTQYVKGYVWAANSGDINDTFVDKTIKRADDIENRALAMYTDAELAAQAHARLYRYKEIAERYSHTQYAQHLLSTCDSYKDYVTKKK